VSAISTTLFLAEPFKSAWQNEDVFLEVRKLSNAANGKDLYRDKEGRRTLRFAFDGHKTGRRDYFLKYHQGVGWKEIFKNLLQLRSPVLGASNEYYAAVKLKSLGVDTLTPVAYGCRGKNPARQESFLITEDLSDSISLEDYCRNWNAEPPPFRNKRALIKKIAKSAKLMHQEGINHRDFYLCHFLLDAKGFDKSLQNNVDTFHCYLIDLHRCQIRKNVPRRWLVKDLGGLLYSSMDIGLSVRDYFRFIKTYTGKPLRESLRDSIWSDVLINAETLYQKDFGKTPRMIFHKQATKNQSARHT